MRKLRVLLISAILVLSLTACGSSSYESSYDSGYSSSGIRTDVADMNSLNTSSSASSWLDFGGTSSQSSKSEYKEAVTEEYYEETLPESETDGKVDNDTNNNFILLEDKLIYRCNLSLETLEFDKTYNSVLDLVASMGGIIQSERFNNNIDYYPSYDRYYDEKYIDGKECTLTVRIPSENYREFTTITGELGNLVSKNSTTENITQQYYDTTAQVEGLKIQLARLQEMMKSAYEIEDLITINKEISDLEYRIGLLTTEIRTMDMDTAYSYVTVSILEVVEYTEFEEIKEDTFFNRLVDTFKESFENFGGFLEELLFMVIILAPFIILIVIVIIVVKIFFGKKLKARKERKKQEYKDLISFLSNKSPENKTNGEFNNEPKQ